MHCNEHLDYLRLIFVGLKNISQLLYYLQIVRLGDDAKHYIVDTVYNDCIMTCFMPREPLYKLDQAFHCGFMLLRT
jgi:hypothetical protein